MKVPITSYRDLKVWQKAIDLVASAYRATADFPKREVYGLASQLQRSAVSVPANIAEGHGRDHLGDYLHHLSVAYGSLMELETHFIIGGRLGYLADADLQSLLKDTDEIGRMLSSLKRSLRERQKAASV